MQEVSDRPQFGGVISRIFVLSRRSAFPEGKMATSSPPSPRPQRKLKPRNLSPTGQRTPLVSSLIGSRMRVSRNLRIDVMTRCPARSLRTKMLQSLFADALHGRGPDHAGFQDERRRNSFRLPTD